MKMTKSDQIKAKQEKLILQIDSRMQSRFIGGNKPPELIIIVSSKSSDKSFLESDVDTARKLIKTE